MDEVVANLKAVLLSSKGGVSLNRVNKDYYSLIGERIPYRKFNFNDLEGFLLSIPSFRRSIRGGEVFFEAIPSAKTAHVADLVQKQKSEKKKKKTNSNVNFRSIRTPYSFNQNSQRRWQPSSNNYQSNQNNRGGNNFSAPRYQTNMKKSPSPTSNGSFRYPPVENVKTVPVQMSNVRYSPPERAPAWNLPSASAQNAAVKQMEREPPKATSKLQSRLVVTPKPVNNYENLSRSPPKVEIREDIENKRPCQSAEVSSIIPFEEFVNRTPIEELEYLAKKLNFHPPVYKISKAIHKLIYASVSVGDETYSSYPEAIKSEYDAKTLAATRAVDELKKKTNTAAIPVTENKNLIKERILRIIDSHPTGVFSTQIMKYYTQEFQELLTQDWLQIIKACAEIEIEKGVDNTVILTRKVVKEESSAQEEKDNPQLSPFSRMHTHPYIRHSPGELQVPDDTYWATYVTVVYNTEEVWIRIVDADYSDKFLEMTVTMSDFYTKHEDSTKAMQVEVGTHYTMCVDESWYRVKCLEVIPETGEATVYFIDHGDDQPCHVSMLHEISQQFCELPAQALRVSLHGLEDFSDFEEAKTVLEDKLLEKIHYIEVKGVDSNRVFSVVFYDTKGEADINLNKLMSVEIINTCIPKPQVKEGRIHEVFVSQICRNGDVYVQLKDPSLLYLVNFMNKLIEEKLVNDLSNFKVTKMNILKVYLTKLPETDSWYRVRITNFNQQTDEAELLAVDFGFSFKAKMSDLIDLESLSDILYLFPTQAILVNLFKIPLASFNDEKIEKLKKIVPPSESMLLKVVQTASNRAPVVELFNRQEPNNEIVSVVELLESEMKKVGDSNNNKVGKRNERMRLLSRSTEQDNVTHKKTLKMPKIPEINQKFKVHVTLVSNPGNFLVQPLEDQEALKRMNQKLQIECNTYKGETLNFENVQEGALYAARHSNGDWRRACVLNKFKTEVMVTVYICDYGEVTLVNLKNLLPLSAHFFDLPYQAIRARLAGVKAISGDWLVEDCMRFKELIENKNMVSVVKSISSVGGEVVLTLEFQNENLILIQERRAEPI